MKGSGTSHGRRRARARAHSRKATSRLVQYLALALVTLIVLTPIVLMVFGGLKTRGELTTRPYAIPNPPHWENYGRILGNPRSGACWATACW